MVMYNNSIRENNAQDYGLGVFKISGKNVLSLRDEENIHTVEWHHCAGHSCGREVLNFYPKNEKELAAVHRLIAAVQKDKLKIKNEKNDLKKQGLPTSKAALWRHLIANGDTDMGFGCVEARNGKYGWFKISFGNAEKVFYFDSPEIAKLAEKKL